MKSARNKLTAKKMPPALARVRKAVPPPTKVFKSKKIDQRQQRKAELRLELKANLLRKSS